MFTKHSQFANSKFKVTVTSTLSSFCWVLKTHLFTVLFLTSHAMLRRLTSWRCIIIIIIISVTLSIFCISRRSLTVLGDFVVVWLCHPNLFVFTLHYITNSTIHFKQTIGGLSSPDAQVNAGLHKVAIYNPFIVTAMLYPLQSPLRADISWMDDWRIRCASLGLLECCTIQNTFVSHLKATNIKM